MRGSGVEDARRQEQSKLEGPMPEPVDKTKKAAEIDAKLKRADQGDETERLLAMLAELNGTVGDAVKRLDAMEAANFTKPKPSDNTSGGSAEVEDPATRNADLTEAQLKAD